MRSPDRVQRSSVSQESGRRQFASLNTCLAVLEESIENTIGLRAQVRLVQPRTIPRSEGKAKRVIDQRKL